MRLLFELDRKDYADCTRRYVRDSARSIIIRDKKVAMIHSLRYDYYKFPGGGIHEDENPVDAMIRETQEEAGLVVIPSSVREYGYVHRIQKSDDDPSTCFVQDNYYYLCQAQKDIVAQSLDDYESKEKFTLEFIDPKEVIQRNREATSGPKKWTMVKEREARILEMLLSEGLLTE